MRLQLAALGTSAMPASSQSLPRGWARAPWAVLTLCLSCWSCSALAQNNSGSWGGSIEGRGNYFWERSTRVIVPEVKATVTAPDGTNVGVGYLLDAISSASISAGAGNDQVATEYRHALALEAGRPFDLGSSQLDLGVHGIYSSENDYTSLALGLSSGLWLNQKNTKLSLYATGVSDQIRSNADPSFDGHLKGLSASAGIEQVLSPVLLLTLNYQFGYLDGFLGNPYRRALSAAHAPEREAPPTTRYRHGISSHLSWFIPATDTAVHLIYASYLDSWDVAAVIPEIRIYQQVTRDFLVRPRYRLYVQSKASFQRAKYPAGWDGPTTADPKLSALTTHTVGLSLEYRLSFLAHTVFDFAKDAWLDVALDRYFSNSSFGNAILGTAGGRLEF